jgi:hypothetical protein
VLDALIARGVESPYTWTLLTFTLLSMLAIPLFFAAGRRFQRDRDELYAAWQADVAPAPGG